MTQATVSQTNIEVVVKVTGPPARISQTNIEVVVKGPRPRWGWGVGRYGWSITK